MIVYGWLQYHVCSTERIGYVVIAQQAILSISGSELSGPVNYTACMHACMHNCSLGGLLLLIMASSALCHDCEEDEGVLHVDTVKTQHGNEYCATAKNDCTSGTSCNNQP